ncbi:hypothetical protein N7495_007254 [Penicillium taxi]|uniref:uncharacterized protein n=1 Tax=Penicillium taxi TaxID=168475 RepID=UPI0025453C6B|nr:uncharacterized protein N7495_007254 [Penicillium taxi]KAJ5895563.1 hypothetical protein N7495_007254 [Penicillium taxi]
MGCTYSVLCAWYSVLGVTVLGWTEGGEIKYKSCNPGFWVGLVESHKIPGPSEQDSTGYTLEAAEQKQ